MSSSAQGLAGTWRPSWLQVTTSQNSSNVPKPPGSATNPAASSALGQPNATAIGGFLIFVSITLGITYWAARRTKTTEHFFAAARSVTGFQNGLALAGDYMSAASFLGIAGLVALSGFDGLIYSIGFLVGWPIVMFLIAEPLRNLGRYTFTDENEPDRDEWLEFLKLLKKYRSAAPINGLILAIAADTVLGKESDELVEDARGMRQKLDELVRELGIQFPVYLLVTKCDLIEGFTEFLGRLPRRRLDEMLGWTNGSWEMGDPRKLVGEAFQRLGERLQKMRPGFLWDARIRMGPGLPVFVHDAYVAGRGVLTARLFGLVTVMDAEQSKELAEGEFLRWVAEAAWYPTALLPSQGAAWRYLDDRSALLTMRDGITAATVTVGFDAEGRIARVRAERRARETPDGPVPTPWEGRFWDYVQQDGMWIPRQGEVAWLLPDGPRPYWRGHIERVTYTFLR